jgi:hypothetical protein
VTDTAYGQVAIDPTTVTEARLVGKDTETIVRSYFSDIPVMIQIAHCESTFRHTLADGSVLHGVVDSADTGVMQINTRYHGGVAREMGLDLTKLNDNLTYARKLYERQGTRPWAASAPCWSAESIAMR